MVSSKTTTSSSTISKKKGHSDGVQKAKNYFDEKKNIPLELSYLIEGFAKDSNIDLSGVKNDWCRTGEKIRKNIKFVSEMNVRREPVIELEARINPYNVMKKKYERILSILKSHVSFDEKIKWQIVHDEYNNLKYFHSKFYLPDIEKVRFGDTETIQNTIEILDNIFVANNWIPKYKK